MDARGIAGIVIDGATRDAADIRRLMFPTFARAVTPRNFAYPLREKGSVNVQISCGGTIVNPGDLVIGDDDGVVVVPREAAEQMAIFIGQAYTADVEKRRGDLKRPFGLEEELVRNGYRIEDDPGGPSA